MYRERRAPLPGAVTWTSAASAPGWVLPDGCMDLMWHAGRVVVAGPDTAAYRTLPDGEPWIGLRLAPGQLPQLLGVPAHELADQRVALDQLWPAARARRLTAVVAAAASPGAGLEQAALHLTGGSDPRDPVLRESVSALSAGRRVDEVAARVGLSSRQLHRRCRDALGYGPKVFARITRLQGALADARAGAPFADCAHRHGYSDQQHLAREVRALTDSTLTALAS